MTPPARAWWKPYLGGAFLWRGREPQLNRRQSPAGAAVGVDCWGLYAHAMRHVFGRPVDDYGWAYPGDGDEGRAQARARIAHELPNWFEVPWEEGAAALFRIDGRPVHVGICLAQHGYVLHAHRDTGVDTLRIRTSIAWKGRFAGCFLPY